MIHLGKDVVIWEIIQLLILAGISARK